MIHSRRRLLSEGWKERQLARAVRDGTLVCVRRGWYIAHDAWDGMWPEDQHRARVIAVARDARVPAPMSYVSAAVLHGLPLYRVVPRRVHTTTGTSPRNASGDDVMRHIEPLRPDDVTVVDGIRCTTLVRTVFYLIRTLPMEAAVSVADAAERSMAERGRDWLLPARETWRRGLEQRILGATGVRGIRQARFVATFADGRAQLPGESVSRLQLHRLGFAPPRLQVEVAGPAHHRYFVDFGLDDVHAFGEFDGEGKYRDEALRAGKLIDEVMLAEKQREDWIRGRTQRRFARWGSIHILQARHLGARLASFGIRAP